MRDLDLVRLYWPARVRPAFDALFAIDAAMAAVVRTTSEPALGAIRLAWWRERLEDLDLGRVPAEPTLQAAASELLPRGVSGASLAGLEPGWAALLQPFPWDDEVALAVEGRGRTLFALAAGLLGGGVPAGGGEAWALVDVARRCSNGEARALLLGRAGAILPAVPAASSVRPITMLTRLAARDLARGEPFEPEATPGRAMALLGHRLTGRISPI